MTNKLSDMQLRVLAVCCSRSWSLDWESRLAHMHLELAEFTEAIRGKRGDPVEEAGDVLFGFLAMTGANGISLCAVVHKLSEKLERLAVAPPYAGEERTDSQTPPAAGDSSGGQQEPVDLGNGFFAVPYDACTLNGIYLPQLNKFPAGYTGEWAVMSPKGRALDGEDNRRPYRYASLDECRRDVDRIVNQCGGGHSVCS